MVLKTVRDRHADGISSAFLLLWLFGEIFGIAYLVGLDLTLAEKLPTAANYAFNAVCIGITGLYKLSSRPSPNRYPLE